MDAVKAFMERSRMCKSHYGCGDCPLHGKCGGIIGALEDAKEWVNIVERWSKEHPLKTNGMALMEKLGRMGVPCRRTWMNELEQKVEISIDAEWWNAEYKEGE